MVSSHQQSGTSSRLIRRNDISFSRTVKECLDNHLYIDGWMFQIMLEDYPDLIKSLALVYVDNKPVALSMVWEYPEIYEETGEHIGCFVKKEFRGNGYGEQAVILLGGVRGREWKEGISGSGHFWANIEERELSDLSEVGFLGRGVDGLARPIQYV